MRASPRSARCNAPLALRALRRWRVDARLVRASACWLALAACADETNPSFPRFIESLSDAGPAGCPEVSPGSGADCTRRNLVCSYPRDVQCACGTERVAEFGATVWSCYGGESAACPGVEPRPDSLCKAPETLRDCKYGDRTCACDETRERWSCWRPDDDCPVTAFESDGEHCPTEGAMCQYLQDGGSQASCLCRGRLWTCAISSDAGTDIE